MRLLGRLAEKVCSTRPVILTYTSLKPVSFQVEASMQLSYVKVHDNPQTSITAVEEQIKFWAEADFHNTVTAKQYMED